MKVWVTKLQGEVPEPVGPVPFIGVIQVTNRPLGGTSPSSQVYGLSNKKKRTKNNECVTDKWWLVTGVTKQDTALFFCCYSKSGTSPFIATIRTSRHTPEPEMGSLKKKTIPLNKKIKNKKKEENSINEK